MSNRIGDSLGASIPAGFTTGGAGGVGEAATEQSSDTRSRFEVENDAAEGVANLSGEDMTQLRGFLASVNEATGGDEEISDFLKEGAHLKFVDDSEFTSDVRGKFDADTGDVMIPISMAKEALEAIGKLPDGAISADGTVDSTVLQSNKDVLEGANLLNSLVTHEYEHLEQNDLGQHDNYARLASLVDKGNWGPNSETNGADRDLVDAVTLAVKLERGNYRSKEGEIGDGPANENGVGTGIITDVLREYDANLAEEQANTKLVQLGLLDESDVKRLVTDESGQPLDKRIAAKNLLDDALRPEDKEKLGLDLDADKPAPAAGDSLLGLSEKYDESDDAPGRRGRG